MSIPAILVGAAESEHRAALMRRFEAKWESEPNTGCWLWFAGADKLGYGRFGIGTTVYLAHRISWELYVSSIPEGMGVLHRCDTPACVNPAHLFIGSQLDNLLDMVAKGRSNNQLKTHCPYGHEYTEDNTTLETYRRGTRKAVRRHCRVCHTAACRDYDNRKRQEATV
jgi:hypothetical protein